MGEEDLPTRHHALREDIRKQIQSATKVIVIWGSASANSSWVNYELGLADALRKPILVVMPVNDATELPAGLQNVRIVRLPIRS